MSFYGRANRVFIEQALKKEGLRNSQIAECDLSGLKAEDACWDHTDLRDLHANGAEFQRMRFTESAFFRSSLLRARFADSVFNRMTLDGLTLIKSRWQGCVFTNTALRNNCLQRAEFRGCRFISSTLFDFEALNARMDNCIIAHSMLGVEYGSGMNGLSGAAVSNCIFYNCRFEGFPLRGALLRSTVFACCSGQIGDDMDCVNVAGLGLRGGRPKPLPLAKAGEAAMLLDRLAS